MKAFRLFIFFIFVTTLFLTSCEESPEGIQATLFGEEGEGGGPFFSEPTFTYSQQFESTSNGYINWGETIGFDFYVNNYANESSLSNVTVEIISITPSTYISEYDDEESQISFVSANSSATPSFSWCVDYANSLLVSCTQPNDGYVGNFYFNTANSSFGTVTITVNMQIDYDYEGTSYRSNFSQDLTVSN